MTKREVKQLVTDLMNTLPPGDALHQERVFEERLPMMMEVWGQDAYLSVVSYLAREGAYKLLCDREDEESGYAEAALASEARKKVLS